ncbi:TPA: IS3 family transposase, partial [Salmonella enterica subsp. enterica serovar Mississippi]
DNACVESFFHSLKVECIHGEHFSCSGSQSKSKSLRLAISANFGSH